jgi:hypothetical protein
MSYYILPSDTRGQIDFDCDLSVPVADNPQSPVTLRYKRTTGEHAALLIAGRSNAPFVTISGPKTVLAQLTLELDGRQVPHIRLPPLVTNKRKAEAKPDDERETKKTKTEETL